MPSFSKTRDAFFFVENFCKFVENHEYEISISNSDYFLIDAFYAKIWVKKSGGEAILFFFVIFFFCTEIKNITPYRFCFLVQSSHRTEA